MMASSHHDKKVTESQETMEIAKPELKEKALTNFLLRFTLVICLGSLQCGFTFWLVNDPITLKHDYYNVTAQILDKKSWSTEVNPTLLIFTVVFFLVGSLFGSILFGPLADKSGRKRTLLVSDLFSIVSSFILAFSQSWESHIAFVLGCFFTGLYTGLFACAIPMFLGEIAPTNLRGGLGIIPWFVFTVGMLISQILGAPELLGTPKGLPILLSIPGLMGLFQLFLVLLFPDSPRYLLIQKRDEEGARKVLQKLRGEDDVEDEIEDLRQEDVYEQNEKQMTILKLLNVPHLRIQLLCVITLFAIQQFSGLNAVYYYAEKVFAGMNIQITDFRYSSAMLTLSGLFGQGLSVTKIDNWGRRPLLLGGFAICIITCVLLIITLQLQTVISWIANISSFLLLLFLTGIVLGPNAIPHLMTTELFLQSSRASAFAVVGVFQWFLITLVGFTFIAIERFMKTYCFLIYLPFCIAGFVYILKVVPETKKKTFLDIRKILDGFLARKLLDEKPPVKKKQQMS